MKIYHNGRDITGKFTRETFINKTMKKLKAAWYWTKLFIGVGFVGAVIGGFFVGLVSSTSASYASAASPIVVNEMPNKIDALKNEVVEDLAKCESGGKKEEDGIVILDTNNVGSYGVLQFQRTTVMHYYEKMTGQKINGRDAIVLALDSTRAKELGKWIIFETKNGVEKDWVNCSRVHGLQARVDLIKKLEN